MRNDNGLQLKSPSHLGADLKPGRGKYVPQEHAHHACGARQDGRKLKHTILAYGARDFQKGAKLVATPAWQWACRDIDSPRCGRLPRGPNHLRPRDSPPKLVNDAAGDSGRIARAKFNRKGLRIIACRSKGYAINCLNVESSSEDRKGHRHAAINRHESMPVSPDIPMERSDGDALSPINGFARRRNDRILTRTVNRPRPCGFST